jgi:hypothetical protein
MSHSHNHCSHVQVKFCSHCNLVYCLSCSQEWTLRYNSTPYPHQYQYWGTLTAGAGGGTTLYAGDPNKQAQSMSIGAAPSVSHCKHGA